MEHVQAALGLLALIALCWAFSTNRQAVSWRPVVWGVILQFIIAAVVLLADFGKGIFDFIDRGMNKLVDFSQAGSNFVFQAVEHHQITVVSDSNVPIVKDIIGEISPPLKTIAFWVLPTIIFFSALIAVAYHYGVMQKVVGFFARIMNKTLGTSGAESLANAANIFVGQTEAPLLVKPYVGTMTLSELHSVMLNGFANTAGGVLAIYIAVLPIAGIGGHLVTATLMSAPAAVAVAKLLVPETEIPQTLGTVQVPVERIDYNGLDALARGTTEGLSLFLNVLAMLLVFFAVVTMVNFLLHAIGGLVGVDISLELIFGYLFAPFALLMGVPWDEALRVGMLLGKKITLTELMAYLDLANIQHSAAPLSDRTAKIASYALAGFANFASIGIQIGGISVMAPHRRGDLARLSMRAMLGGMVATMMCGAVAGIFI